MQNNMIQNPQINKEQRPNAARKFPLGKICTDINQFEQSLNTSLLIKKFKSLGGNLDSLPKPLDPSYIKEIEDFITKNSIN